MPMKDLEAILFDLDGVIIDSEPLHEKAFRQTSLHGGVVISLPFYCLLKRTETEAYWNRGTEAPDAAHA
jgi:beta-phosphoglucomutase-like phosphatase (HAD superfamily)